MNRRRVIPAFYRLFVLHRTNLRQARLSPATLLVTIVGMDGGARKLDAEQARALCIALGPRLAWLGKLSARMDRLGIDPQDPIVLATREAHHALHALRVLAHYRSCPGGVGQPPAVISDQIDRGA